MSEQKQRRLGRGLEALIGSVNSGATATELQRIPVSRIRPNPYQPRREFDAAELSELESSIRANGLLQPISVRRSGDSYELIAGERRLRAVGRLGWNEVPAIVRDFDDRTLLVLALVENLQRTDLNPLEEARGYQRLLEEFSLTHQGVADAVGRDRTTVTNLLRLLALPDSIQRFVEAGQLSAGHAKALLVITDVRAMIELANTVVAQGMSVRQTEQRARSLKPEPAPDTAALTARKPDSARRDPAAARIEDELRRYLQTDVQLQLSGAEKGVIRISFYSSEDLDRLTDLMLHGNRPDF
jgi:ParB family transcriptional regulator, chromosome partitioning protein